MSPRGAVSWPGAAVIVLGVAAIDQLTKAWALRALQGGPARTVLPGLFDLTFSRNTGGVFGLLSGTPTFGRRALFVAATALALALIFALLRQAGRESRLLFAGLTLVAGGAVGNLVDRVRFGSVVDFIDWYWRGHHWYTFNVADAAISTGAVLILLHSFLPHRPPLDLGGLGRD